jgi:AraC-like DNA-binding protein/mannose-6-phosphate isomerase-like protein (cupin superfamily)
MRDEAQSGGRGEVSDVRSVRHLFRTLVRHGIAAQEFATYDAARDVWHTHDMVEMCFVLAGEAEHLLDDRVLPLRPGSLAIIHYGQRHKYRTLRGPIALVNVYLDAEAALPPAIDPDLGRFVPSIVPLARSFVHDQNRLLHLPFDELEALRPILLGLCSESGRQEEASPAALRSWYTLLLTACARRAGELGQRPAGREQWPGGLVEDVRLQLDGRPEEAHELGALAARARMTPSSFCRAFKRHTGRTLVEYLHHRRIERAMVLLGQGDHTVAQAALTSGFQDISHFNRVFRRLAGKPPRDWLKGRVADRNE